MNAHTGCTQVLMHCTPTPAPAPTLTWPCTAGAPPRARILQGPTGEAADRVIMAVGTGFDQFYHPRMKGSHGLFHTLHTRCTRIGCVAEPAVDPAYLADEAVQLLFQLLPGAQAQHGSAMHRTPHHNLA